MKVLLLLPPDSFIKQGYGINQKVKFGHMPSLGLGYIAAYLEMDQHEVMILDACAEGLTIEETVARAIAFNPDNIGMSVLTNNAGDAAKVAEALRKGLPDVLIHVGGAHATYFYSEILDDMPAVDHVLYGEADTVIRQYMRDCRDPQKFGDIKGLVFRKEDGSIQINPAAELIQNLDEVPMPAWHLYNMSLYRPLPFQSRKSPFFTLITSRGCHWGRCKFCFQAGYCKPPFRRHSVDRVIEEIKILYYKFGIREISFWDDTFLVNPSWIRDFCTKLKALKLDLSWVASGRVNFMTEEMVRLVYESGCWSMFIGIESGNQDILELIEKGITLEQSRKAFKFINEIGIETRAAFILGLPTETPQKGMNTINFAIELNPTYAVFYAAHPRRGTALHEIALVQGTFLDSSYRGMSKITYVPDGYKDAEELSQIVRKAYRKFYLRPSKVWQTLKKVRSLRGIKELAWSVLLFMGLSDSK